MGIFDRYITKLAEYIRDRRAEGGLFREMYAGPVAGTASGNGHGSARKRASSNLILRSDTFVELGHPASGSCNFILWTDNPTLIENGRITLIGPDIPEMTEASLSFGQVITIGGQGITGEDQESLERAQYIVDNIYGYMIRSAPQRIWSRVGKQAVAGGFCFERLGRALIENFKASSSKIETMEILFVSSNKDDVEQLDVIASQVQKIARGIRKKIWRDKGVDIECTQNWNCASCPEKFVCDEIRKVVSVRKGNS